MQAQRRNPNRQICSNRSGANEALPSFLPWDFIDLCSLSSALKRAARATQATGLIHESCLEIQRRREHQQFAQHGFESHVGGGPRNPFEGMLQLRRGE